MPQIRKRVVLHFPGYEPLDAEAHYSRYARSAMQSGRAWNFRVEAGPLGGDPAAPCFSVRAEGPGWRTDSRIHILDHNGLILALRSRPTLARLAAGCRAGVRVIRYGGMAGYFRHAWRFGLFFLFPFLLAALGAAVLLAAASLPLLAGLSAWNLLWTLPAAVLVFFKAFLPMAERFHTLHLFDDWRLAVSLARMDDAAANARLEEMVRAARAALREDADEYVVASHSMGSSLAVHVIGMLLEREPQFFGGRKVVFATLGGAVCQCALLAPAAQLRRRVGLIARCGDVFWLEVQCLTDAVNFYRVKVVEAAGFADLPQAAILRIRFRHMVTPERYRRIKRDFLRMHRQYVLGPDRRAPFDFTLMTAGPLEAESFAGFSTGRLAPLRADGSLAPHRNPKVDIA